MFHPIGIASERFGACVTFVWLEAVVCVHVLLQLLPSWEALAAEAAGVLLHLRMSLAVLHQPVLSVVYLAAHLTDVDDGFKVLGDMFLDHVLLSIVLVAYGTLVYSFPVSF